jgi:predicted ATPase with chaperone activity
LIRGDVCPFSQFTSSAYDSILKVPRTSADLAGRGQIEAEYAGDAIQYRTLDRNSVDLKFADYS